ncbi:protein kinase domain-containing protein [Ditylenchus destructor]|uniref:non-specific serine/threonine protein kinase n=1 Tax=Ditylenchus destructor TaxID=166010 RepID=A0AAD4R7Y4_9BILA|nr:protein kinase domain-containing protein [Ditylenchus destructor]
MLFFGVCSLYQVKSDPLHKKVVIKSISLECRNETEKKAILYEAHLLKQLSHPNIIKLQSSFVELEQLNIVMEFVDGGTMEAMIKERVNRLGQDLILYYFTQVVIAINYIHSKKILHRDLKTQNIFLNCKKTIVKVGDFGISKELSSKNMASTVIGTANYLSPELCEGRAYDLKSDIWSMGCILYELVELCKAFDGDSFMSIVVRITRGKHGPISSEVSTQMKQLILHMLQLDERKRPTTKEILTHPLVIQKWYEIHVNLGRLNSPNIVI